MPLYEFTGTPVLPIHSSQPGGTVINGGTTHSPIIFTLSITYSSLGPFSYFDANGYIGIVAYGVHWDAQFSIAFIPSTTTVTGLQFQTNLAPDTVVTSSLTFNGYTHIHFTFSGRNNIKIEGFNARCFLEGTRIATPTGEVAVQDLSAGDFVLTADGGQTTVQWLGRQDMTPRFQHPDKINPICITAGALADGLPKRDLYLSADHAIELDGLLINAGALVNGGSIHQVAEMPLDGFTYFHVETDAHQVILAEGCPAETYLDIPSRDVFNNSAERVDAAPIAEMPHHRITTTRLLPPPLRRQIAARAADRPKRLVA